MRSLTAKRREKRTVLFARSAFCDPKGDSKSAFCDPIPITVRCETTLLHKRTPYPTLPPLVKGGRQVEASPNKICECT